MLHFDFTPCLCGGLFYQVEGTYTEANAYWEDEHEKDAFYLYGDSRGFYFKLDLCAGWR